MNAKAAAELTSWTAASKGDSAVFEGKAKVREEESGGASHVHPRDRGGEPPILDVSSSVRSALAGDLCLLSVLQTSHLYTVPRPPAIGSTV